MKRKAIVFGLAATLLASAVFAAVTGSAGTATTTKTTAQLYVTAANGVDLLSEKGGFGEVVASVPHGKAITVLAREGKWLTVEFNGKQGFVYQDNLSPDKPMGTFIAGGINTGMSEGAAGKGLGPTATAYATGKNLSSKDFDALIAFSKTIKGDDVTAFESAGKVGLAKP